MGEETKAVRSDDLKHERWDLLSGAACRHLCLVTDTRDYALEAERLINEAICYVQGFLGYDSMLIPAGDRLSILLKGWWKLSAAIQVLDATEPELRMLRECSELHYPYCALKRLARTLYEGASKYGDENWLYGFPIKELANHTIAHLISVSSMRCPLSKFWKDETEDELGHAMFGFMAMVHMMLYRNDMCLNLLGIDYTITDEIREFHASRGVKHDNG